MPAGLINVQRPRGGLIALACCLILAPLWLVTMFHRGLWTPDEPREADITWRMSTQQDHAVPSLAGQPFLEKPPLAYWAGAIALTVGPRYIATLRLPNFLYACLATFAIALLACSEGTALVAWIATLVAATFVLSLQVASWLATDAAMMLGVAGALLGFYRGFTAPHGLPKLRWYTLTHTALAWAFLAKGPAAWLVPVPAAVGFCILERNWRELLRWELWVPLVVPAVAILVWLSAVTRAADGAHQLAVLLWYNVAGRVVELSAHDAATYAQGHRNWPGKYFLQFPMFVAPWTFLFIAALRRAWFAIRNPPARLWRFAVCAWLVPLLALTFASTARGIYAAPTLPGAALLIGLWFARHYKDPDRFERAMLRATLGLIALLAVTLFSASVFIELAQPEVHGFLPIFPASVLIVGLLLSRARMWSKKERWRPFLLATCATFVLTMISAGWLLFPAIDRWQDIASVIRQIDRDAGTRELHLLAPDETTIALVDLHATLHRGRWRILPDTAANFPPAHNETPAAVLLLLPGHADGPLTRRLRSWGFRTSARRPVPPNVERVYEVPHGRRYALLSDARNNGRP